MTTLSAPATTTPTTSPTATARSGSAGNHSTGSAPASRPRRSALVAGLGLLAMTIVGVFANFVAIDALVTDGDPITTAADIASSETLFRFGILGLAAVAALDILVAWALHDTFRPVHRNGARLATWFRAIYAAAMLAAITHLQGAVRSLDDGDPLAHVEAFRDAWTLSLGIFGLHLVVAGWLVWRTSWLPRFLGALVAVAGVGYVADAAGTVLSADYDTNVAAFTFYGEPLLMVWLLVHGVRALARPAVDLVERVA